MKPYRFNFAPSHRRPALAEWVTIGLCFFLVVLHARALYVSFQAGILEQEVIQTTLRPYEILGINQRATLRQLDTRIAGLKPVIPEALNVHDALENMNLSWFELLKELERNLSGTGGAGVRANRIAFSRSGEDWNLHFTGQYKPGREFPWHPIFYSLGRLASSSYFERVALTNKDWSTGTAGAEDQVQFQILARVTRK